MLNVVNVHLLSQCVERLDYLASSGLITRREKQEKENRALGLNYASERQSSTGTREKHRDIGPI